MADRATGRLVVPAVEGGRERVALPGGEALTTLTLERLRGRHREARERYLQTRERRSIREGFEMTGLHRDGPEIDLRISFSALETTGGHRFTGIIRPAGDRSTPTEP